MEMGFKNGLQPEESLASEIVNKIQTMTITSVEKADEFIFQRISPFCELCFQMKIKKSILIRALSEFFENHPEERETLKKEDEAWKK